MRVRLLMTGALAGLTLLGACGDIPDLRYGPRPGFFPQPSAPAAPGAIPGPSSSQAEQACMTAGTGAGFEVLGVVGTREITGADGLAVSRDVMLRVRSGGQTVEVRCNFAYDTAAARIMTL